LIPIALVLIVGITQVRIAWKASRSRHDRSNATIE